MDARGKIAKGTSPSISGVDVRVRGGAARKKKPSKKENDCKKVVPMSEDVWPDSKEGRGGKEARGGKFGGQVGGEG